MKAEDVKDEIYWVRLDKYGNVTGALVEKCYTAEELADELKDMRKFGKLKRILASRVVIGEALKDHCQLLYAD